MQQYAPPAPESCNPAPYGKACANCSRAKCKCFYKSDGSGCERCHRLGKECEPSTATRKRRLHRITPPPPPPPPSVLSNQSPQPNRIEEKLDDLVALIRAQASEKQGSIPGAPPISPTQQDLHTPSSMATPAGSRSLSGTSPADHPEIAIDTGATVVKFLRPSSDLDRRHPEVGLPSPLLQDVLVHAFPTHVADEQLTTFRNSFLPAFPFAHIPVTKSSLQLREEKPFLWLVIMAISTKSVAQQFAMEKTIWYIISHRVTAQQHMDLDCFLGIICFASWSHFFKTDKPFMTMLTQLAFSIALELNFHKEAMIEANQRAKSGRLLPRKPQHYRPRTLEERRGFLALFHLSSTTWATFRKTEPLRWTPFLADCLRLLEHAPESVLDSVLVTQIKCQIITNQLSRTVSEGTDAGEDFKAPSAVLSAALLGQLNEVRRTLPAEVESYANVQFYLCSAELVIKEAGLRRTYTRDHTGFSQFQKLQDLEAVLTAAECWLSVFNAAPLLDHLGMTIDRFTQFTHCLVTLFKLSTLKEPGWDVQQVKNRADVLTILEITAEMGESVPAAAGIVDDVPSRPGMFTKTKFLFQAIRVLFMQEMGPEISQSQTQQFDTQMMEPKAHDPVPDFQIPQELMMALAEEPWISDVYTDVWDLGNDPLLQSFQAP